MLERVSLLIAGLALIISAYQSWLSWNARDDHLEVIHAERMMNACADVGVGAASYAALMEPVLRGVQSGQFDPARFEVLSDARSDLRRVHLLGSYVLGPEQQEDLLVLRDTGLAFPGAAFDDDAERAQTLFNSFDAAGKAIQARCRNHN